MLTGQPSSPRNIASMATGGSSNPAVMRVVTPAESAAGTRFGESRWTWLSMAPGVAISP